MPAAAPTHAAPPSVLIEVSLHRIVAIATLLDRLSLGHMADDLRETVCDLIEAEHKIRTLEETARPLSRREQEAAGRRVWSLDDWRKRPLPERKVIPIRGELFEEAPI
jgi:hypothetical protein